MPFTYRQLNTAADTEVLPNEVIPSNILYYKSITWDKKPLKVGLIWIIK